MALHIQLINQSAEQCDAFLRVPLLHIAAIQNVLLFQVLIVVRLQFSLRKRNHLDQGDLQLPSGAQRHLTEVEWITAIELDAFGATLADLFRARTSLPEPCDRGIALLQLLHHTMINLPEQAQLGIVIRFRGQRGQLLMFLRSFLLLSHSGVLALTNARADNLRQHEANPKCERTGRNPLERGMLENRTEEQARYHEDLHKGPGVNSAFLSHKMSFLSYVDLGGQNKMSCKESKHTYSPYMHVLIRWGDRRHRRLRWGSSAPGEPCRGPSAQALDHSGRSPHHRSSA